MTAPRLEPTALGLRASMPTQEGCALASDPARERSVELADLSRLHDRVVAIRHELDDIGLTKVGRDRDDELRRVAQNAHSAALGVLTYIEERIGDPSAYVQPEPGDGTR